MRSDRRRWLPATSFACAALLACRPLEPLPKTPPPAEQPVEPAAKPPPPAELVFRYTPGTRRYTVHTEATIELASDAAAPQRVPLETMARFTLILAPHAERALALSGSVDSFAVTRGEGIPAPENPAEVHIRFSAVLVPTGQVRAFEGPPAEGCGSPVQSLLAQARDLVVAVPASLTIGSTWRDTTAVVTCRGDIPVTTRAVREYVVEGRDSVAGAAAIRVRRTSTMTLGGRGTQGGEPVSVSGTGAGTATLYLSPSVGALLGATGTSRSTLTVETPRGRVPFRQEAAQRITLER
jgi:hypothetical protein